MFKGKIPILKDIIYITLLVIHAILFAYFLYYAFFNYFFTVISSLTIVSLVTLAFYSFLTTKSYYYYFYIAIILCSFPIIFIVQYSAVLIVPELIILLILMARGLDSGTIYYKMKVDKKASIMHHDPAVFNLRGRIALNPGRMNEVWNPDSTVPMPNTGASLKKSNLKMQIITFLLTIVYFICSIISVYVFNS